MTRQRRPSGKQRYLWIGLAAVAVFVFVALLFAAASRPRGPRVGDHWHARYAVVICGERRPQFPFTQGGVHTHGDGVIHIHPQLSSESGRNATLGRFFGSAGVKFTRDSIAFPDGKAYRNGDRCPDGRLGTLHLLVNRTRSNAFDRYIPQDGDSLVVEFGPER